MMMAALLLVLPAFSFTVAVNVPIADYSRSLNNSYCILPSGQIIDGPGDCSNGEALLVGQYVNIGIHNVGSYGIRNSMQSSYYNDRLGFLADFDRNGMSTSSPGYSGDYFIPGAPLEGWLVQYVGSSGVATDLMSEGLMNRQSMTPSTVLITSTADVQSLVWVGRFGEIEVKKVTQFAHDKLYFTTSVVVKNIGPVALQDFYYMRTVDPDQELKFYGTFNTRNYVKYQQSYQGYINQEEPNMCLVCAAGVNNYDFFVGLGTINPNAKVSHFGFQIFNPVQAYTDKIWENYGGSETESAPEYASRMRLADEAIHLVYKYPIIQPGETVNFDYAYVVNADDIHEALDSLAAIFIDQPTDILSGERAVIQASIRHRVQNASPVPFAITSCAFSIFGTRFFQPHTLSLSSADDDSIEGNETMSTTPGSLQEAERLALPQWYSIGMTRDVTLAQNSSYFVCSITLDATGFLDGAPVHIRVIANTSTEEALTKDKVLVVENRGLILCYNVSDDGGTYPLTPYDSMTLGMVDCTVTDVANSSLYVSSVTFFLEALQGGEVSSRLLMSDDNAPFHVKLTAADVQLYSTGTSVTIKANVLTRSYTNTSVEYTTTSVFSGLIVPVYAPPSAVFLSSTHVSEDSPPNSTIGQLSSTGGGIVNGAAALANTTAGGSGGGAGDQAQQYSYSLVDSGMGDYFCIEAIGNASYLVLHKPIDYEQLISTTGSDEIPILIQSSTGLPYNCCTQAEFKIKVFDANESPLDVTPVEFSIEENLPPGVHLGQFSVIDLDIFDHQRYEFYLLAPAIAMSMLRINSTSGDFYSRVSFNFEDPRLQSEPAIVQNGTVEGEERKFLLATIRIVDVSSLAVISGVLFDNSTEASFVAEDNTTGGHTAGNSTSVVEAVPSSVNHALFIDRNVTLWIINVNDAPSNMTFTCNRLSLLDAQQTDSNRTEDNGERSTEKGVTIAGGVVAIPCPISFTTPVGTVLGAFSAQDEDTETPYTADPFVQGKYLDHNSSDEKNRSAFSVLPSQQPFVYRIVEQHSLDDAMDQVDVDSESVSLLPVLGVTINGSLHIAGTPALGPNGLIQRVQSIYRIVVTVEVTDLAGIGQSTEQRFVVDVLPPERYPPIVASAECFCDEDRVVGRSVLSLSHHPVYLYPDVTVGYSLNATNAGEGSRMGDSELVISSGRVCEVLAWSNDLSDLSYAISSISVAPILAVTTESIVDSANSSRSSIDSGEGLYNGSSSAHNAGAYLTSSFEATVLSSDSFPFTLDSCSGTFFVNHSLFLSEQTWISYPPSSGSGMSAGVWAYSELLFNVTVLVYSSNGLRESSHVLIRVVNTNQAPVFRFPSNRGDNGMRDECFTEGMENAGYTRRRWLMDDGTNFSSPTNTLFNSTRNSTHTTGSINGTTNSTASIADAIQNSTLSRIDNFTTNATVTPSADPVRVPTDTSLNSTSDGSTITVGGLSGNATYTSNATHPHPVYNNHTFSPSFNPTSTPTFSPSHINNSNNGVSDPPLCNGPTIGPSTSDQHVYDSSGRLRVLRFYVLENSSAGDVLAADLSQYVFDPDDYTVSYEYYADKNFGNDPITTGNSSAEEILFCCVKIFSIVHGNSEQHIFGLQVHKSERNDSSASFTHSNVAFSHTSTDLILLNGKHTEDPQENVFSSSSPFVHLLDYEARQLYSMTLRVTDVGGLFDEVQLELHVVDVPEPPRFMQRSSGNLFGYTSEDALEGERTVVGSQIVVLGSDTESRLFRIDVVEKANANKSLSRMPFRLNPVVIETSLPFMQCGYENVPNEPTNQTDIVVSSNSTSDTGRRHLHNVEGFTMYSCTFELSSIAPVAFVLEVCEPSEIDFEQQDQYHMIVSVYDVADSLNLRDSINYSVQVLDADEPVVFAQTDIHASVSENATQFTPIGHAMLNYCLDLDNPAQGVVTMVPISDVCSSAIFPASALSVEALNAVRFRIADFGDDGETRTFAMDPVAGQLYLALPQGRLRYIRTRSYRYIIEALDLSTGYISLANVSIHVRYAPREMEFLPFRVGSILDESDGKISSNFSASVGDFGTVSDLSPATLILSVKENIDPDDRPYVTLSGQPFAFAVIGGGDCGNKTFAIESVALIKPALATGAFYEEVIWDALNYSSSGVEATTATGRMASPFTVEAATSNSAFLRVTGFPGQSPFNFERGSAYAVHVRAIADKSVECADDQFYGGEADSCAPDGHQRALQNTGRFLSENITNAENVTLSGANKTESFNGSASGFPTAEPTAGGSKAPTTEFTTYSPSSIPSTLLTHAPTINLSSFHEPHQQSKMTATTTITLHIENANDAPTVPEEGRNVMCFVPQYAAGGTFVCNIIAQDEDSYISPLGWGSLSYHIVSTTVTIPVEIARGNETSAELSSGNGSHAVNTDASAWFRVKNRHNLGYLHLNEIFSRRQLTSASQNSSESDPNPSENPKLSPIFGNSSTDDFNASGSILHPSVFPTASVSNYPTPEPSLLSTRGSVTNGTMSGASSSSNSTASNATAINLFSWNNTDEASNVTTPVDVLVSGIEVSSWISAVGATAMLEIVAVDGGGLASGPCRVTIQVVAEEHFPPVCPAEVRHHFGYSGNGTESAHRSSNFLFFVEESVSAGNSIGAVGAVDGSISATAGSASELDVANSPAAGVITDPKGLPLRYEIIAGDEKGSFRVDSITGLVSTTAVGLNFESQSTFSLAVRATQLISSSSALLTAAAPPLSTTCTISVIVVDVNEPPVFDPVQTFVVDEHLTPGSPLSVGNVLAARIQIFDPDIEDKSGAIFSLRCISCIASCPIDSLPIDSATQSNVVASNDSTAGSATSNMNTLEGSRFCDPIDINPVTGQLFLKLNGSLDFETISEYHYLAIWKSRGISAQINVTVQVSNVNEPPRVYSTSIERPILVPENFPFDGITAVTYVNATDPDYSLYFVDAVTTADETNNSPSTRSRVSLYCGGACGLRYELRGGGRSVFGVDALTGMIYLLSPLQGGRGLDYENQDSYELVVRVTDENGHGMYSEGSIHITVLDIADCSILSISRVNGSAAVRLPTVGGDTVVINGRNLGPTKQRLEYVYLSQNATSSNSSITQYSSTSNGNTAAVSKWATDIAVWLKNPLFPDFTLVLRDCELHRSDLIDNTQIRCVLPPGIGTDFEVSLSTRFALDQTNRTWSNSCVCSVAASEDTTTSRIYFKTLGYAAPRLDSVFSTLQSVLVEDHATFPPTLLFSNASKSDDGRWQNDSICGSGLLNDTSEIYYSPETCSAIQLAIKSSIAKNASMNVANSTVGSNSNSRWILLLGSNFGPSGTAYNLISAAYWSAQSSRFFSMSTATSFSTSISGATIAADALSCRVGVDHVLLLCDATTSSVGRAPLTQASLGRDINWQIEVGGQVSNTLVNATSFAPPEILSVSMSQPCFGTVPTSLSSPSNTSADSSSNTSTAVDFRSGNNESHTPVSSVFSFTVRGRFLGSDISQISVLFGSSADSSFQYAASCVFMDAADDIAFGNDTDSGIDGNIAELQCFPPSLGLGKDMYVSIQVYGQLSDPRFQSALSYCPPIIRSVYVRGGAGAERLSTIGGEEINIHGANFGPLSPFPDKSMFNLTQEGVALYAFASHRTSYQVENVSNITDQPAKDMLSATHCRVSNRAGSSMVCLSPPGVGFALSWQLTLGEQTSNVLPSSIAYAAPVVSALRVLPSLYITEASSRAANSSGTTHHHIQQSSYEGYMPTNGESIVEISGFNFGASMRSVDKVMYYSEARSVVKRSISSSSVDNLATNGSLGSICHPEEVYTEILSHSNADGNSSMSGGAEFDVTAMCNMTEAHRQLRCNSMPGAGRDMHWRILVSGQGSVHPTTSYAPPIITNVILESDSQLSKNGSSLNCTSHYRDAHSKNGTHDTNVMSNTSVECASNGSVSIEQSSIHLVPGMLFHIIGQNFGPISSQNEKHLCPRNPTTNSCTPRMLDHVSFGLSGEEYVVTSDCWVSTAHTRISCVTPPGVGRSLFWRVVIAGQSSTLFPTRISTSSGLEAGHSHFPGYPAPVIKTLSPLAAQTSGRVQIVISAHHIGAWTESASDRQIDIFFDEFPVVYALSETSETIIAGSQFYLTIPEARSNTAKGESCLPYPGSRSIRLSAGGQWSNALWFQYEPPRIRSATVVASPPCNVSHSSSPMAPDNENITISADCGAYRLVILGSSFTRYPIVSIGEPSFSSKNGSNVDDKTRWLVAQCTSLSHEEIVCDIARRSGSVMVETFATHSTSGRVSANNSSSTAQLTVDGANGVRCESASGELKIATLGMHGGLASNAVQFSDDAPVILASTLVDSKEAVLRWVDSDGSSPAHPVCTLRRAQTAGHTVQSPSYLLLSGQHLFDAFAFNESILRTLNANSDASMSDLSERFYTSSGFTSIDNPQAIQAHFPLKVFILSSKFAVAQKDQDRIVLGATQHECKIVAAVSVSHLLSPGLWYHMAGEVMAQTLDAKPPHEGVDFQRILCEVPPGLGVSNSIKVFRWDSASAAAVENSTDVHNSTKFLYRAGYAVASAFSADTNNTAASMDPSRKLIALSGDGGMGCGCASCPTFLCLSYRSPELLSIYPSDIFPDSDLSIDLVMPTSGGSDLILIGNNFGYASLDLYGVNPTNREYEGSISVRIGGKPAVLDFSRSNNSHLFVSAIPSGVGRNKALEIAVGGQSSTYTARYTDASATLLVPNHQSKSLVQLNSSSDLSISSNSSHGLSAEQLADFFSYPSICEEQEHRPHNQPNLVYFAPHFTVSYAAPVLNRLEFGPLSSKGAENQSIPISMRTSGSDILTSTDFLTLCNNSSSCESEEFILEFYRNRSFLVIHGENFGRPEETPPSAVSLLRSRIILKGDTSLSSGKIDDSAKFVHCQPIASQKNADAVASESLVTQSFPSIAFLSPDLSSTAGLDGTHTLMLCESRITLSVWYRTDSNIVVAIPSGTGAGYRIEVNVSGQIAMSTASSFQYAAPTMLSVSPLRCSTEGGRASDTLVTVKGLNLGAVASGMSDSSPSHSSKSEVYFIPTYPVSSITDNSSSHDDHAIKNGSTSLQRIVPLWAHRVRVNDSEIVLSSATELRFFPPAGQGRDYIIEVVVDGQSSLSSWVTNQLNHAVVDMEVALMTTSLTDFYPESAIFSYFEPTIAYLSVASGSGIEASVQRAADTRGGEHLLIHGSSFGVHGARVVISDPGYLRTLADNLTVDSDGWGFNKRSKRVSMQAVLCPVLSQMHTVIVCTLPPGMGRDLTVTVTVHSASVTLRYYSLSEPFLRYEALQDCGTVVDAANPMAICSTRSVQASIAQNLSYASPRLSSIHQSAGGDALGGELVRIFGQNFGPRPSRVHFGFAHTSTRAYSDSNGTTTAAQVDGVEGAEHWEIESACRDRTALWLADDPSIGFQPYVQCITKPTTVGLKSIALWAAHQSSSVYTDALSNATSSAEVAVWVPELGAEQPVNVEYFHYKVECKQGSYGVTGEFCTPCGDRVHVENKPRLSTTLENSSNLEERSIGSGTVCPFNDMPVPLAARGWYVLYDNIPSTRCSQAIQTLQLLLAQKHAQEGKLEQLGLDGSAVRTRCPHAVPCFPRSACAGGKYLAATDRTVKRSTSLSTTYLISEMGTENIAIENGDQYLSTCHESGFYTGERCGYCAASVSFRINQLCQSCAVADWAVAMLTIFLLLLVVCCIIKFLGAGKSNQAIVGRFYIIVDHLQTLGQLSLILPSSSYNDSGSAIPAAITNTLNVLSVFSFNPEILSSSCFSTEESSSTAATTDDASSSSSFSTRSSAESGDMSPSEFVSLFAVIDVLPIILSVVCIVGLCVVNYSAQSLHSCASSLHPSETSNQNVAKEGTGKSRRANENRVSESCKRYTDNGSDSERSSEDRSITHGTADRSYPGSFRGSDRSRRRNRNRDRERDNKRGDGDNVYDLYDSASTDDDNSISSSTSGSRHRGAYSHRQTAGHEDRNMQGNAPKLGLEYVRSTGGKINRGSHLNNKNNNNNNNNNSNNNKAADEDRNNCHSDREARNSSVDADDWVVNFMQRTVFTSRVGTSTVSICLLVLVYLYSTLLQNTLSVFNCNPVLSPTSTSIIDGDSSYSASPDSAWYLAALGIKPAGVCYEPHTIQHTLAPFALVSIISHSLLIPYAIYLFIRAGSNGYDALGVSDACKPSVNIVGGGKSRALFDQTALTHRRAGECRKARSTPASSAEAMLCFAKTSSLVSAYTIQNKFRNVSQRRTDLWDNKGSFWRNPADYWVVVTLLRKAVLQCTLLVLRRNPLLALSSALLCLFSNYQLHNYISPYPGRYLSAGSNDALQAWPKYILPSSSCYRHWLDFNAVEAFLISTQIYIVAVLIAFQSTIPLPDGLSSWLIVSSISATVFGILFFFVALFESCAAWNDGIDEENNSDAALGARLHGHEVATGRERAGERNSVTFGTIKALYAGNRTANPVHLQRDQNGNQIPDANETDARSGASNSGMRRLSDGLTSIQRNFSHQSTTLYNLFAQYSGDSEHFDDGASVRAPVAVSVVGQHSGIAISADGAEAQAETGKGGVRYKRSGDAFSKMEAATVTSSGDELGRRSQQRRHLPPLPPCVPPLSQQRQNGEPDRISKASRQSSMFSTTLLDDTTTGRREDEEEKESGKSGERQLRSGVRSSFNPILIDRVRRGSTHNNANSSTTTNTAGTSTIGDKGRSSYGGRDSIGSGSMTTQIDGASLSSLGLRRSMHRRPSSVQGRGQEAEKEPPALGERIEFIPPPPPPPNRPPPVPPGKVPNAAFIRTPPPPPPLPVPLPPISSNLQHQANHTNKVSNDPKKESKADDGATDTDNDGSAPRNPLALQRGRGRERQQMRAALHGELLRARSPLTHRGDTMNYGETERTMPVSDGVRDAGGASLDGSSAAPPLERGGGEGGAKGLWSSIYSEMKASRGKQHLGLTSLHQQNADRAGGWFGFGGSGGLSPSGEGRVGRKTGKRQPPQDILQGARRSSVGDYWSFLGKNDEVDGIDGSNELNGGLQNPSLSDADVQALAAVAGIAAEQDEKHAKWLHKARDKTTRRWKALRKTNYRSSIVAARQGRGRIFYDANQNPIRHHNDKSDLAQLGKHGKMRENDDRGNEKGGIAGARLGEIFGDGRQREREQGRGYTTNAGWARSPGPRSEEMHTPVPTVFQTMRNAANAALGGKD